MGTTEKIYKNGWKQKQQRRSKEMEVTYCSRQYFYFGICDIEYKENFKEEKTINSPE